jgi:hypothetical protein
MIYHVKPNKIQVVPKAAKDPELSDWPEKSLIIFMK